MATTTARNVILKSKLGQSSCEISLFGATVVSWICNGEEILFVSTKSRTDGTKAIRGGIPLVFPNFGPWNLGPQHGFARIQYWTAKEPIENENGDVSATFILSDNEETKSMWKHSFKLVYTVTLGKDSLKTHLEVQNTGDEEFDFTCLLHTYVRVNDISAITVSGLEGLTYIDKVKEGGEFVEDRQLVSISGNVDRVYKSTTSDHLVNGIRNGQTLLVTKENFPDTVVWNPWAEKAASMSDFGDAEYVNMICVEPGAVANRCILSPQSNFCCSQVLKLLPKSVV